jgi:hypothetical protein
MTRQRYRLIEELVAGMHPGAGVLSVTECRPRPAAWPVNDLLQQAVVVTGRTDEGGGCGLLRVQFVKAAAGGREQVTVVERYAPHYSEHDALRFALQLHGW